MPHLGRNIENESDWRRGARGHARDRGNEQNIASPLPANGEFIGRWRRIDKSNALSILYGATAPYSLFVEWSQDGQVKDPNPFITITPGSVFANGLHITISNLEAFHGKWYRVRVKNNLTIPQAFAGSVVTILPQPFPGHRVPILGGVPLLGVGNITLATQWGKNGNGWKALKVKESGEVDQPTLETKLDAMITLLQQVFGAVDDLEMTAENVRLEADQINLSTDQVETKLDSILDALTRADPYRHIDTAGTHVLKVGPGILKRVVINRYMTTAPVTLTLYDSSIPAEDIPANAIAIVQVGLNIVGLAVPPPPMNLDYNAPLVRGLRVVMSAVGPDVTVSYG